ncbi:MAG: hypothetical protein JXQ90_13385 [Cyclobacteriaceae bacterium]
MKHYLTFIATLSFFVSLAQDKSPATLIDGNIRKISGYGSFITGLQMVKGDVWNLSGGEGVVILNEKLLIGGYGVGSRHDRRTSDGDYHWEGLSHGGIVLGYVFNNENMVHLKASTRIGKGTLTFYDDSQVNRAGHSHDNTTVINPQLELEVNVTHWMRGRLGGGVLLMHGLDNHLYKDHNFIRPNLELAFAFGWFK